MSDFSDVLSLIKKAGDNKYHLCKSCTKAERNGKPITAGCQKMVAFCKDRKGRHGGQKTILFLLVVLWLKLRETAIPTI